MRGRRGGGAYVTKIRAAVAGRRLKAGYGVGEGGLWCGACAAVSLMIQSSRGAAAWYHSCRTC